ncbi:MAG: hypothetical protein Q9166_000661 [cf. Caloplaca sp. 2 TL-2023]
MAKRKHAPEHTLVGLTKQMEITIKSTPERPPFADKNPIDSMSRLRDFDRLLRQRSRQIEDMAAKTNDPSISSTLAQCAQEIGRLNVTLSDASKSTGLPDVTIRWDTEGYLDHHKVSFPLSENDTASESLVQHCQPVTFGHGDRDVLDETYRKASKLDNTAFSTNFHPHDCGIVDAVQQILMPSTLDASQGGTLRVKHRGQVVSFAWAERDPKSIKWAAFYGDYGCIGFFCYHAYAHSTEAGRKPLPGAFKGVDLAVYPAFCALGLKVGVHPILHNTMTNIDGYPVNNKWGGMSVGKLLRGPRTDGLTQGDFVEEHLDELAPPTRSTTMSDNEDCSKYDK